MAIKLLTIIMMFVLRSIVYC